MQVYEGTKERYCALPADAQKKLIDGLQSLPFCDWQIRQAFEKADPIIGHFLDIYYILPRCYTSFFETLNQIVRP